MIKLAVISSIPTLTALASQGDMEMALSHMVLLHPRYADYYRRQSKAGKWVILDNSAFELEEKTGAGLSADLVLEAAEAIGATELICQDILYDGPATVEATRSFIDCVESQCKSSYSLMGVPQGLSIEEWLECYEALASLPEIGTIGLSKLSIPASWKCSLAEARLACVEQLLAMGVSKPLHLLGGGPELPWELRQLSQCPAVRSNDSSFAFWYAVKGVRVDPSTLRAESEVLVKPDLEATSLDVEGLERATETVQLLRRCARGG